MSVAVMRYSTITLGEVIDCPKNFGHLVQVFYCLGDKIRVDIRHIRPTVKTHVYVFTCLVTFETVK